MDWGYYIPSWWWDGNRGKAKVRVRPPSGGITLGDTWSCDEDRVGITIRWDCTTTLSYVYINNKFITWL